MKTMCMGANDHISEQRELDVQGAYTWHTQQKQQLLLGPRKGSVRDSSTRSCNEGTTPSQTHDGSREHIHSLHPHIWHWLTETSVIQARQRRLWRLPYRDLAGSMC